jgi:hypothetical protein
MKDRMKWFCTVGGKHRVRVFINTKEDKVRLKARFRNLRTTCETDVTCPYDLDNFLFNLRDQMEASQVKKLQEIKDKMGKSCHNNCTRECIAELNVDDIEDEDDDNIEDDDINFIIGLGCV